MNSLLKYTLIAFAGILLVSCSSPIRLSNYPDNSQDFKSSPNTSAASQKATMRPYTINGKTYYPTTVSVGDTASGTASWYGPDFHGKKTSNGETYNMNAMTAAHKTLPMNTMVRVTNLNNGRQTTVRINDRGPFVAGRIIDLSRAAASSIDMLGAGTARVKLEVVGFYGDGNNYATTSTPSVSSTTSTKSWGSGVSGAIISAGITGAISGGISGAASSAGAAAKSAAKSAASTAVRQAVDKGVEKASQKISGAFEKNSNAKLANSSLENSSNENDFSGVNDPNSENSANFGEPKITRGQQSFEGGSFMVQIGAFKRLEGAESFKNSNANKYGYKTLIRTFDIDGEKIYRVFLSGFRSEAEARDFVEAKHFGGAYIVRE